MDIGSRLVAIVVSAFYVAWLVPGSLKRQVVLEMLNTRHHKLMYSLGSIIFVVVLVQELCTTCP
jgi:hypothetical protein